MVGDEFHNWMAGLFKTGNNQMVDKRIGLVGALSEIALLFCWGYLGITYFRNLETSLDTSRTHDARMTSSFVGTYFS